jgi:hypothetical protein
MVHGGAYWTGDKTDSIVIQRCQAFAAKGVTVFNINYRLTGDQGLVPAGWPATDRDNMSWIPRYAYPAVRDTKVRPLHPPLPQGACREGGRAAVIYSPCTIAAAAQGASGMSYTGPGRWLGGCPLAAGQRGQLRRGQQ